MMLEPVVDFILGFSDGFWQTVILRRGVLAMREKRQSRAAYRLAILMWLD